MVSHSTFHLFICYAPFDEQTFWARLSVVHQVGRKITTSQGQPGLHSKFKFWANQGYIVKHYLAVSKNQNTTTSPPPNNKNKSKNRESESEKEKRRKCAGARGPEGRGARMGYVCPVHAVAWGSEASDPLELQFHLGATWCGAKNKPGSLLRAESPLNCWVISTALADMFLKTKLST